MEILFNSWKEKSEIPQFLDNVIHDHDLSLDNEFDWVLNALNSYKVFCFSGAWTVPVEQLQWLHKTDFCKNALKILILQPVSIWSTVSWNPPISKLKHSNNVHFHSDWLFWMISQVILRFNSSRVTELTCQNSTWQGSHFMILVVWSHWKFFTMLNYSVHNALPTSMNF